jgi:hypothetical protein
MEVLTWDRTWRLAEAFVFTLCGHRLHLGPAAVVVLESDDPLGAGGDLVRLAFGNRRVSRFRLASLHWRRRRLAMMLANWAASLIALTWLETATTIPVALPVSRVGAFWSGFCFKTWHAAGSGTDRARHGAPPASSARVSPPRRFPNRFSSRDVSVGTVSTRLFRVGQVIGLYCTRHSFARFSFNGFSDA